MNRQSQENQWDNENVQIEHPKREVSEIDLTSIQSKTTIKLQDIKGDHHQNIGNRSENKSSIFKDMSRMNEQLEYIGIQPFHTIEQCSHNHLNELSRVVDQLMRHRYIEKQKSKEVHKHSYNLEHQRTKLIREIDTLHFQLQKMRSEKDETTERMKQSQKDFKAKQQMWQKERENMLRQKRALEAWESTFKAQIRKRETKILKLEDKLRKIMQKNDKNVKFMNSFEVYQQISKQQKTLIQAECDTLLEKKLKEKQINLQMQNEDIKKYLIFIFEKIFKIVVSNPEQISNKIQHERCINILNMPFCHAQAFIEKMNNMIDKIQEMIHKKEELSYNQNGQENDHSNMIFLMQKMKSVFKDTQELQSKRSQFSADLFSMMERKQKLSIPKLQKINNSITSSPRFVNDPFFESQMRELERQRQKEQLQNKRMNDAYNLIKQQMQFNRRQSLLMGQISNTINSQDTYEDDNLL